MTSEAEKNIKEAMNRFERERKAILPRKDVSPDIDIDNIITTKLKLLLGDEADDIIEDLSTIDKSSMDTFADINPIRFVRQDGRTPISFVLGIVGSLVSEEFTDKLIDKPEGFIKRMKVDVPFTIDIAKDEALLQELISIPFDHIIQFALIMLYLAIARAARNPALKLTAARLFVKRLILYAAMKRAKDDPKYDAEQAITRYIMMLNALAKEQEDVKFIEYMDDITKQTIFNIFSIIGRIMLLMNSIESPLESIPTNYALIMILLPVAIARLCKSSGHYGVTHCLNAIRHNKKLMQTTNIVETIKKLIGEDYEKVLGNDSVIKDIVEKLLSEGGHSYLAVALQALLNAMGEESW